MLFFVVAIPAILFRIPGLKIPIFQRGFYCDDQTLSYPYKSSTVPVAALYGVGVGFPIILVCFVYNNFKMCFLKQWHLVWIGSCYM